MESGTLALVIFAVIFIQLLAFVLVKYYRIKQQQDAKEISASETEGVQHETLDDAPVRPSEPLHAVAWQGYRDFVVQRREIEDQAGSVCSFYLAPANGVPLAPFKPGQFVTFRLHIADSPGGNATDHVRCYSLSDKFHPDHYRVTIKRVLPASGQPGLPPGRCSSFFHDHVQAGTHLQLKAPSGHFHLINGSMTPVVLLAGGIGLTPMLSIINTLLESNNQREVWLFYGVRNRAEHLMREHLNTLADTHPEFHLHVCYSRPGDDDQIGTDYQHTGHVDIRLLRLSLQLRHYQFYVCGPSAMMESLVPALVQWGVAMADIHYEAFGPASLPRHRESVTGPDNIPLGSAPLKVTFSKSNRCVQWDPGSGSLLEFAEQMGIQVDSGCRAGSCGSCQTVLEDGTVAYSQDPDMELPPGSCLLCISRPITDLKIRA